MRPTVLGGCGAWPEAGQACSGFLVEHDWFRLLTHLMPGTDHGAAQAGASAGYGGPVDVPTPGLVLDLD